MTSELGKPPSPAEVAVASRVTTFGRWVAARTLSRVLVRIVSSLGIGLVILGITGWWLTTRILSDTGFGDVVAKTVRQAPVRQYLAEQVTIKLAPTNKIFTAARPVATAVVAEVLSQPAISTTVQNVVAGLHRQIFRIGNNDTRVNVSAQSAAATLRATLQSIDPAVSQKFPDSVLNIATNITQNEVIDTAATAAPYIRWLYLPVGLLGALLLYLVFVKAHDPVHAVRFTGFTMMVMGALPIGLGSATPLFAAIAGDGEPGRGKAVAAFVHVLLGRLVGAGWAFVLVGLLLVLAPGRDGAGVAVRVARFRAWFDRVRTSRAGQLAGGAFTVVVGVALLTVPTALLSLAGLIAALVVVFFGLLLLLRGGGVIQSAAAIPRVRKRQAIAITVAMVLGATLTTTATGAAIEAAKPSKHANPNQNGCNGYFELCPQPLNQIVFAASHNAMSTVSDNFFTAEHVSNVSEQLNQGARALLIDAYTGYRDSGITRTVITGPVNRQAVTDELGPDALRELDRLGALTGATVKPGKKTDVYLCHLFCEVGSVKATTVFSQVNDFLDKNLTDVVVLDVEDYVSPAQLEVALKAGHLWDRLYHLDLSKPMPTLFDLVNPPAGQDEQRRRVIITSERHAGEVPWLIGSYQLMQETPYTFNSVSEFNCRPNRGAATNPMLLVNHWLRAPGPPDPVETAQTNNKSVLISRLKQCIAARGRLPNFVAVDFFGLGDTVDVCNMYNSAVALLSGVTAAEDRVIVKVRHDPKSTDAELEQLDDLQRLPDMTTSQARALLGPLATKLAKPALTN